MDSFGYIKAICKHWWALMSCALFTLLGTWILCANKSNAWAVRATFVLAGFCFLAANYLAWRDERGRVVVAEKEKSDLSKRYFDERPLLGLEIHSLEGPSDWNTAYSRDVCVFTISQISGRIAQAIRFDPIPSKCGKFVLNFDPIPFSDRAPRSTPLRYEISEPPHQQLSGADREKTGDMEGKLLYLFLNDNSSSTPLLEYEVTARFKDQDEINSQTFKIIFDTRAYRFLYGTD